MTFIVLFSGTYHNIAGMSSFLSQPVAECDGLVTEMKSVEVTCLSPVQQGAFWKTHIMY